MSQPDINIEDFIHRARTLQDEYANLTYFAASDRQLAEFVDESLALARAYAALASEVGFLKKYPERQPQPYRPDPSIPLGPSPLGLQPLFPFGGSDRVKWGPVQPWC